MKVLAHRKVVVPPPKPEIVSVTINMSYEEAVTLLILCRKISGSTVWSRRKHTDALAKELRAALIEIPLINCSEGSINFLGDPQMETDG